MEKKSIILNVDIEPIYLVKEVKTYILQKIKDKYINSCSEKNGYIVDILSVDEIIGNTINQINNNVIFSVLCNVYILKPEKDKEIDCTVNMIFNHGLFISNNKLKLLIPTSNMKNYTYNQKINQFENNKETIKLNDKVLVKITDIKYNNKQYSCIGDFIKKL